MQNMYNPFHHTKYRMLRRIISNFLKSVKNHPEDEPIDSLEWLYM